MYALLTGYNPFQGKNDADTIKKIRRGKFHIEGPHWDTISSDAKDLLTRLLTKNPSQRISAEEACAHPWFKAD